MLNKKKVCFFTACSICYLQKALVLAESVYKIEGEKVIIYIIDRKSTYIKDYDFAEIRWIEDENIPNFRQLSFIYDVTEFSTSIKPHIAKSLLKYNSSVIFLDPDICVYNSLQTLYKDLENYPIVLTPHYTTPQASLEEGYDQAMMRFGSFNLGFFAVNDSKEAIDFLTWWNERCMNLCFFETQFGLSTDQKWISIAPCFFPNIKIIFDKGYNMAFWNIQERRLTKSEGKYWVNDETPLTFFHFSSFNTVQPELVSTRYHKWIEKGREDLKEICISYSKSIKRLDEEFSIVEYGFDYFNNGFYISPTLRRAYACTRLNLSIDDPFQFEGNMKKFVKRNYLLEKKGTYKTAGKDSISRYNYKFKLVYFFMRKILQFLGPNQFTNFSRLLVYLSSYRQNEGLWKL